MHRCKYSSVALQLIEGIVLAKMSSETPLVSLLRQTKSIIVFCKVDMGKGGVC